MQKDEIKKALEDQIEALNKLRDTFADIPKAWEEAMNKLKASEMFGSNWEIDILNPSDDLINNFRNQYTGTQDQIQNNENSYKQIWIASKMDFATDNDILEIQGGGSPSNPDRIITVKNLATYSETINHQVQDFFQLGNDFRYAVCDEIIAKGVATAKDIGKTYIYEKLRDCNISFDTFTKSIDISSISDFDFNERSDIWSIPIEIPYNYKKTIYIDMQLNITRKVNKYKSVESDGKYKWEFDSIEEQMHSYNFDIIRTFSDYKDAISRICFRSSGISPSTPTDLNQYAYDAEGYYERYYSSDNIPSDNFTIQFQCDDSDWMYVNSSTLSPIKIEFTFKVIYIKDVYSNTSYESLQDLPYVVLSQFTYEELRKINPHNYLSTSCEDISKIPCDLISRYSCDNLNKFGVRIK